jgi:hypothetical protein
MSKKKETSAIITVKGSPITVVPNDLGEFISLTDMVKSFEGIKNVARHKGFYLSAKSWIERTRASIMSRAGLASGGSSSGYLGVVSKKFSRKMLDCFEITLLCYLACDLRTVESIN